MKWIFYHLRNNFLMGFGFGILIFVLIFIFITTGLNYFISMISFLDSTFFQTLIIFIALFTAYIVGRKQNKINDTVELYATFDIIKGCFNIPIIHVQNVGTRLVYIDKYVFNGREYKTDSQILPSTYSDALNNFYRVELPTNDEIYVSLEFFYHDLDNRRWITSIYCRKNNDTWDIKTLPKKKD